VYDLDVGTFRDGDGDGVGDLEGVRHGLPYLSWLGIDAVRLRADDVPDSETCDPPAGPFAPTGDHRAQLIEAAAGFGIRTIVEPRHPVGSRVSPGLSAACGPALSMTPWDAGAFRTAISQTLAAHDAGAAAWALSGPGLARPVTRLAGDLRGGRSDGGTAPAQDEIARGARRAEAAALLAAALPGTLYIDQGDELGLPEIEDPARGCPRSEGVEYAPRHRRRRVPLPWAGLDPPFGFSISPVPAGTGQPGNWRELTVAVQQRSERSTLNLYRWALRFRAELPARGLSWIETGASDVLAYRRGDTVCVTNFGTESVPLPAGLNVFIASAASARGRVAGECTLWARCASGSTGWRGWRRRAA
jgi:glycosidase